MSWSEHPLHLTWLVWNATVCQAVRTHSGWPAMLSSKSLCLGTLYRAITAAIIRNMTSPR